MADSHRSALRPRGRPRGRHARLIVRCSTREFPVAMGPLRPVWAARRARWSHAISDALAVSRARIRGGRGGRLIGRCLLCSQVRRERSSGGSTRAAHDLDTLHLRGHLRADQRAREAGPGAHVRFPCHGRLARCRTRASPRDSSRKPAFPILRGVNFNSREGAKDRHQNFLRSVKILLRGDIGKDL